MKELEGIVFCQSCGMPLEKDEDFGTNSDGSKSEEYCNYCYLNGEFTNPNITLEEMIDLCSKAMEGYGIMPFEDAKKLSQQNLPKLKRWK